MMLITLFRHHEIASAALGPPRNDDNRVQESLFLRDKSRKNKLLLRKATSLRAKRGNLILTGFRLFLLRNPPLFDFDLDLDLDFKIARRLPLP